MTTNNVTKKPTAPKTPAAKKPAAAKTSTTAPKTNATKTPAAPKTTASKTGSKIAVFIDINNTAATPINVQEAVSILRTKGTITYGKLYGISGTDFDDIIEGFKFEKSEKSGTAGVDLRLVMEAISLAEKKGFNAAFIWAGVGDLTPLYSRLQDLKIKIITVDVEGLDKTKVEAITLYSALSSTAFTAPRPAGSNAAFAETAATFKNSPIDISSIPVLPRRDEAPAPAEDVVKDLSDEEAMSPQEFREFLVAQALDALENTKIDLDEIDRNIKREEIEFDDSAIKSVDPMGDDEDPIKNAGVSGDDDDVEDAAPINLGDDFGSLNTRKK